MKSDLTVDCDFGNNTKTQVIEFQKRAGLVADGVVGNQTIEKLVSVINGEDRLAPLQTSITYTYNYTTTTTSKTTTSTSKDYSSTSESVIVPSQPENEGNLVWVPVNGGTKYHSNRGCSNMENPIQVSIETAEKNGYTPCHRCH